MHLVVVHPRLEARGRAFRGSPVSRSRPNLCVLRHLTRGPQGQPSPLQTPHSRPGVQGNFPISRGQVHHGWPMVHHSMATGYRISRGCYLPLSVDRFSLLRFVRNPAMSRSPLCHPGTGPVPAAHPLSRFYTAPGRQRPSGAGLRTVDRFVLLARVAPIPSSFFRAPVSRSQGAVVRPLSHRPISPVTASHSATRVYTPRAASNPVARAHWIFIHPGTVLCSLRSHFPSWLIQSVASAHISHVKAPLVYLCIGTRTQRL